MMIGISIHLDARLKKEQMDKAKSAA